jgi:hypothetical protein
MGKPKAASSKSFYETENFGISLHPKDGKNYFFDRTQKG